MVPEPSRFIHATAVVIEDAGVVIRGASGSGKSGLALLLIAEAERRGRFARLVGDDRIAVQVVNAAVVARPHAAIRGLVECRMLGLVHVPFEPACVVRLVVDLTTEHGAAVRLPSDEDGTQVVDGVALPRLCLTSPPDARSCQLVFRKLALR